MEDADVKLAIVEARWRVWYSSKPWNINDWVVQRRTWWGGWRTIARFFTPNEAQQAKEILIAQDVLTFRGSFRELR